MNQLGLLRGRWRRLPVAVRFFVAHWATGFLLGSILVGGLLLFDPGGISTLLRRAGGHPWPTILLWFFCGLTFGGVHCGSAVIMMGVPEEPKPPQGGLREHAAELVPVPVASAAGRRG
jgi:hypothetical protein